MLTQSQQKGLLKTVWFVLSLLFLWAFFRWGLTIVLPFLIGLLLARLVETPVLWLVRRAHWPRWISSAVCVLFCFALLFGFFYLIVARLLVEIGALLRQLPEWMAGFPALAERIALRIQTLIVAAPIEIQDFLNNTLNNIISQGVTIPQSLYTWLGGVVTSAAGAVPGLLLFLVTSVFSSYFISSDYPRVAAFIVRQFPDRWRERIFRTKGHLTGTLGKWLKAQLLLLGITFGILCIGFIVLGVEYPFMVAVVVALVDALPVVGLGIVLVPWALIALIGQNTALGVGLFVLFLVATLTRSFCEPKLVGRQIGLHPLVTLVAMYAGFRIFGILGMIICPILAITVKQLQEWGYIKIWK